MKIRGFIVVLFAVALGAVPQFVNNARAGNQFAAQLISPTAGQVLYPGQKIRVEWRLMLPNIDLGACEMEVFLSLDGGRHFSTMISPALDPKAQYFYWTVPNLPTNQAVMEVRFGCEPGWPESYAPQPASMFTIANGPSSY
jgi:hypothetical protein